MLPGIVNEIAEVIGTEGALRLVQALGGVRVYVPTPERLNEDSELCQVIGIEGAHKLARRYGGLGSFDLPRCAALVREERNREIRTRKDKGESVRSLALSYRMTERQVFNILEAETVQPSLTIDIWGIYEHE